jgi:hypothetical protein
MSLRSQLDTLASSFAQAVVQAIRDLSLEELLAETGGLRGMELTRSRAASVRGPSERELLQMGRGRSGVSRSSSPNAATSRRTRGQPWPERASAPSHARGGRRGSGRLKRRSAADIEKALGAVVSLVEKRPKGLRAEEIRTKLGMEAKEMPRVLGEGLATHKLRKRGHKRATTYYAA